MPDSISALLRRAKTAGRAAFIPYLTGGDPTLETTRATLRALSDAGVDAIELGVPFSDPIADGPVIQRSSERALRNGTSLRRLIELVAEQRQDGWETPVVLFTYFNPVFRMGVPEFAVACARAGAQGALVVDLPPEEATGYCRAMSESGLETIFLTSPTTRSGRLRLIGQASTGCVYYVSRLGVTGPKDALRAALADEVARVRSATGKPVAVGFGISTPDQAAVVGRFADAVVIGSALVSFYERFEPIEAAQRIATYAREVRRALEPPSLRR